MATLNQQIKRAESLTPQRIEDALFRFIKSIEDKIFDLNVKQMDSGIDSFGKDLINHNGWSGRYSPATVEIAKLENTVLPKVAGDLYNFGWFGDFLSNFEMEVANDHVRIYNTGTGSGLKKKFFDGYATKYGLSPNSMELILSEDVQPFLMRFITSNLA